MPSTAVDRGTAALPLLESEQFDLLLTDIVMPEMDGIELAQQAATIAPDIRVMFITGFAAVTLKAGRKAPDAKVLSKPFHLKDLVAEVERMFSPRTSTADCRAETGLRRARRTPALDSPPAWACSSVVEHCVDIAGVASSILATPTIFPFLSEKPPTEGLSASAGHGIVRPRLEIPHRWAAASFRTGRKC